MFAKVQQSGFPYSSSLFVKSENVNVFVGLLEKTQVICHKSLVC